MTTVQRPRSWWIPYIFVAMFLVVVAVNGVMAYLAATTFSGLETDHAYDRGLAYNSTIAQNEEQQRLGWTVTLNVTGEAGASDVGLSLRDRDGRPLTGAKVTADIRRPTDSAFDQSVTLAARGSGLYGATVALPLSGQWDLRVLAEHGGKTYRLRKRVVIP